MVRDAASNARQSDRFPVMPMISASKARKMPMSPLSQLDLRSRKLFGQPRAGLSDRAFTHAQLCHQFFKLRLIFLNIPPQISKESFERFSLARFDQSIEQFQRAHRTGEVIVQVIAQVFHVVRLLIQRPPGASQTLPSFFRGALSQKDDRFLPNTV